MHVYYTGDDRVMGLIREYEGQVFVGLFNFSEEPADVDLEGPSWTELLSGVEFLAPEEDGKVPVYMEGYAYYWLQRGRLDDAVIR